MKGKKEIQREGERERKKERKKEREFSLYFLASFFCLRKQNFLEKKYVTH